MPHENLHSVPVLSSVIALDAVHARSQSDDVNSQKNGVTQNGNYLKINNNANHNDKYWQFILTTFVRIFFSNVMKLHFLLKENAHHNDKYCWESEVSILSLDHFIIKVLKLKFQILNTCKNSLKTTSYQHISYLGIILNSEIFGVKTFDQWRALCGSAKSKTTNPHWSVCIGKNCRPAYCPTWIGNSQLPIHTDPCESTWFTLSEIIEIISNFTKLAYFCSMFIVQTRFFQDMSLGSIEFVCWLIKISFKSSSYVEA